MIRYKQVVIGLMLLLVSGPLMAGEALVAVAANFTATAKELGVAFTQATGHTVTFSFGASGAIYTQIAHGAPYDVFLSADTERPQKAEAGGLAVAGSGFTYALGALALYSADPDLIDADGKVLSQTERFQRLAIASPKTAPYGVAALEVLAALGLESTLAPKIVRGESIAQAYQFVVSGNAQLGFVALSQVVNDTAGAHWVVPTRLYTPIRQDAVLLQHGADNPAAQAFLQFLRGPVASEIISAYGYGLDADR